MEKQTALAWASDLAKKMTAKPSEKAPEGKRVWTCQILCIHNFFLCTLFCAHQFDWMLYLVIGKPKKERDHISYLHTWLTARTVSDWCSTHAAAILDMTKFHFNVFPNIFIWISYSCDCHCSFRIQFSTNKNFRENCTFSCVNANSLRFASACQILYLFIYVDWCWWFRVEFVVSCQRAVATTMTKRYAHTREKVYHCQIEYRWIKRKACGGME